MTALPDLALRPYGESDLDSVRALHALAFERLAAGHHSAADLAASHLVLAVQAEGAVLATTGWIAVPDDAGTARIRKVFVHPDLARRGIASRLVRDAEGRAAAAGHHRLVVRANINAVPLYLKLGYRTLREGDMEAGGGIVLPVHFMAKA
jgi:putative acetyltransferase